MIPRLTSLFIVLAFISGSASANDPVHSRGAFLYMQAPSPYTFAVFSYDGSGQCLRAGVIGPGTVIVQNDCDRTVNFSWCRMRTGTGIPIDSVKCRPRGELRGGLGAREKGYQIPLEHDHYVPVPTRLDDVTREFLVVTTAFEGRTQAVVPAYRVKGDDVVIVRPEARQEGHKRPSSTIRRSPITGGPGGQIFDDAAVNSQGSPISGVTITTGRSGVDFNQKLIARLQSHWPQGAGRVHGGAGGANIRNPEVTTVRFAPNETIRSVKIFHRKYSWPNPSAAPVWVSGIQIETSQRTYSFGDMGGAAAECTAHENEHVIGFFGRSGAYLDALGCLLK